MTSSSGPTLAFLRLFFEALGSGAVVGAGAAGAKSSSSSLSMVYLAFRCASVAAYTQAQHSALLRACRHCLQAAKQSVSLSCHDRLSGLMQHHPSTGGHTEVHLSGRSKCAITLVCLLRLTQQRTSCHSREAQLPISVLFCWAGRAHGALRGCQRTQRRGSGSTPGARAAGSGLGGKLRWCWAAGPGGPGQRPLSRCPLAIPARRTDLEALEVLCQNVHGGGPRVSLACWVRKAEARQIQLTEQTLTLCCWENS